MGQILTDVLDERFAFAAVGLRRHRWYTLAPYRLGLSDSPSRNMSEILLKIDGEVERPLSLSFADLEAFDGQHQLADVSRLDPKRSGDAVRLAGLLDRAGVKQAAGYLTLHATADDFH